jgi:threonine/homoserine/homoserine lactone efflux protein
LIILHFLGHATVTRILVVRAIQSPPIARRLTRAQHWLPYAFGAALLVLAGWITYEVILLQNTRQ